MANYSKIKKFDIANGEGVRTSIFFSGCHFHCKGCHNQSIWSFNVGKEFTQETIDYILNSIGSHIAGISILGGEPLHPINQPATLELCKQFKQKYPDKTIFLWTGFQYEDLLTMAAVKEILEYVDVLIDGQYIESQKNINLKWRGSANQRIIYLGKDKNN